jgi:hypothetical protein
MTEPRTHQASIRWSTEQERQGLPAFSRTTDPVWRVDEVPKQDEGWSLMCNFDSPPVVQGNPSIAQVRYLMPDAPHRLVPAFGYGCSSEGLASMPTLRFLIDDLDLPYNER